jgi:hypothetical protein
VSPRNPWLLAGGWLSVTAALLHLAVILGGPQWYRFFGAGEEMAVAAELGSPVPLLITLTIALLLAVWAAYAFSGAGLIRRLPLIRTALVLISAMYLARGLILLPMIIFYPHVISAIGPFEIWSSLIVLVYGAAYAIGTWRAWPHLSRREVSHALGS